MGVLMPPEQAATEQTPSEQAPLELTIDEPMFRAFGPPSDEDDEENEGDEADEEEEEDGAQQDGGQHQDGPIYRFLFLVKLLFSD
jgi:hypothetical protein